VKFSENYILTQRKILFWDEWLFYLVLGILFFTQHYYIMIPVGLFGAGAVLYSYIRQWIMEKDHLDG